MARNAPARADGGSGGGGQGGFSHISGGGDPNPGLTAVANPGTANTGGGGGGGAWKQPGSARGGQGGSGVVLVRYQYQG